tara:strand:- start:246 stop:617 length:372 start_codon:yes stop_codon:yes gene_type:complete
MLRKRQMIFQSLLIISLLVLPLQNVWAMTDMDSCDMDMSVEHTMSMDMSMCELEMGNALTSEVASTSVDCEDNHCNKCFHAAAFILTNYAVFDDNTAHQRLTLFDSKYLSFYSPLESPPPIIS